ncbi:hypothetical protein Tco_1119877 [Tanacetum coccineum]
MKLYMMNRQHGRMILESVENGPLIWPMIEKNGVTRPKKYSELSATEAIQADYDIKARMQFKQIVTVKSNNYILQGLPQEGKPYVIHLKIFTLLLNDMNIYNMKLEQFQVNTKFLNTLPPEWSKFVTDVKLVCLIVPVFHKGDDPIDAINHIMSFLTAVVISHYPTTNNQLRNSSNPRKQATINDGRVTLQPIQGRQTSFAACTIRTYTPGASGSNSGKQKIVICYNYKGEGHMSKQCTKPTRKRDDSWFKDKVLLVQAQANGQTLHEEELAFLADTGIPEDALGEVHNHDTVNNNVINQAVQAMSSSEQSNVVNRSKTKITSDSNIIPYSQYVIELQQAVVQNSNSFVQQDALILSVIEQLKTQVVNYTKINLNNKSVNDTLTADLERYKEQVKVLKEGQNVDLTKHLKEKESLMQMVTLLKNDFKKEESRNIDREISLEKKIKQLDNIVFKRDQSMQIKAQQLEPKLYDGNVIKNIGSILILDIEKTLMLAEESRSKMILKQKDHLMLEKKVNTTPVNYAVLNQLSQDFEI